MLPRLSLLCIALALAVLTGCTATSIDVRFVAIEPVNELQPGESRPTEVRIFQLRDSAKFDKATVDELWEEDKARATLAEQLIDLKLAGSIFPGKGDTVAPTIIKVEPISMECRFVGVLAMFNSKGAKDDQQKVIVPVADAGSVTFELTGNHITVKK